MKNNKKIKTIVVTISVVLIVVAATAGVTNGWAGWKKNAKAEKEEETLSTVMDETNIGIATNDDPWKEMEKLVEGYYGGEQQVFYSGTMKLFDDNEEKQKVLEEHAFDYSFFRGQYYYKLGEIECVAKDGFILMVNHGDRTMSLAPVLQSTAKQESILDMKKFREMMEAGKATAKVTQNGADKIITVNNVQDPAVQGYQVFYDPASYRIRKIVIGMIRFEPLDAVTENANAASVKEETELDEMEIAGYSYVLEILYEKTSLIPTGKNDFNPENKFIRIDGDHYRPVEAYKNYQLAN
ncbi:MAG TPA: hypothetical protein VGO58_13735 [Chitinophagaceae bacterium]|jgi:hypothetical protein|nr:hypothetical protein [Chitinophagaceae bacterium]